MAILNLTKIIARLAVAALPAAAQSTAARPEFDVASVKLSAAGSRGSSLRTPRGSLDAKNVILTLLISKAYGVEGFQITGGPAWLASDRFDIEAKSAGDATVNQMNARLQSLLEDRFKLKAHRETKEGSIFELVVAKSGFKQQPLKEGSCIASDPVNPPLPPAPGQKPICGVMRPGFNAANKAMTVDVVGMSMPALSKLLTLMVGHPVHDQTGIAGPVDAFHLEYVRDDVPDAAGPSIFTALPEQLGLKLEASKGPVELLVIDHVERPSGN